MIYINKQNEPPLLKQYKKDKQDKGEIPTYEDFTQGEERFKQLRKSLLNEQKYICCYCQQRIPEPLTKTEVRNYKTDGKISLLHRMKTEHFHPKGGKNADLDKILEYENLLAACQGNSDSKKENHCDSAKAHRLLEHITNPAIGRRKDFKNPFRYHPKFYKNKNEGEAIVFAIDEDVDREINTILNLNEQNLRTKRFRAIDAIISRIKTKNNNPNYIKELIDLHKVPKDNKFRPFSGFIIYWLEKRYKKELASL